MKKNALLTAMILCGIVSPTWALDVLNDNFNSYTTGNLEGQGAWTNVASITNPIQVTAAKVVTMTTTGQDLYKSFVDAQSQVNPVVRVNGSYISTDFSLRLSAAQATGDYFTLITGPTLAEHFNRVYAKTSGSGFLLGVQASSTSAVDYGSTILSFGTTYQVSTLWNFISGATNDTIQLSVGGSAYASTTFSGVTAEPSSMATLTLRQGSSSAAATVSGLDNVVVAVPEPSTSLFLATGLLFLLIPRRRGARYRTL